MDNAILAYDISAIFVLLISMVYFVRTNPSRTMRFDILLHIMTMGIAAGVFDIIRVILVRNDVSTGIFWRFFNSGYFFSIASIVVFYFLYIVSVTDTWHLVENHRPVMYGVLALPIAGIIICLSGIFTPVIAVIDKGKNVIYGWGYHAVNGLVIAYMLICCMYTLALVKYIGKRFCQILRIPLWTVVAGFLIQVTFPNHHVLCFCVAINCLYLILIGRKAEDTLDVTTGLHSFVMFGRNMEMNMGTGKQMVLILINILNFEHAVRLVGYDDMRQLMKPMAGEIERIMKSHHAPNICYYNGDGKFAIELSKKHYSKVHEVASEIIRSINRNMQFEVADFELKINACIVNCPRDLNDVESLFMLISDLDFYPSKGKVLSAADITGTQDFIMKKEMNTIIDRALSNHYFSVFYQPILDVNENRFASAEALIRLRDPKYGYISPGVFIPLAEKSGAIHAIGSFVIDEVCKFIASDDFEALGLDYIEINLSVMQCLRSDLADEIIGAAKKYNIDPKKLNLEITETASAYSQEKLHENLRALNEAGFEFSLDDFGTGYSNLMRITSMPLSIIKLDRTFVIMTEERAGFGVIVKNLIRMLKEMGFKVLVEGIETKEMVEAFTSYGVEEIQGFYFSKPLTRTDYISFLKEHQPK